MEVQFLQSGTSTPRGAVAGSGLAALAERKISRLHEGELGPFKDLPEGRPDHWLVCGEDMGQLIRAKTPRSLAWGSDLAQTYNDKYWPSRGEKHHVSTGQDCCECLASDWLAIGRGFEHSAPAATSYLEQRMFLNRNGYIESEQIYV